MEHRYRLYRRGNGYYYSEDCQTGKQKSLRTRDEQAARRIVAARNEATHQPAVSLTLARAYLEAKSPELLSRTWEDVMREMEASYEGPTRERWQTFMRSRPVQSLRALPLLRTESSHFLDVLKHPAAGNSTHKWLRVLHKRALDLGWLLVPVLTKCAWPRITSRQGEAITPAQHRSLVATETDAEFRLYLEMLWETGGAQSDIAGLHRDNVNLAQARLTFGRRKLRNKNKGAVAIVIGRKLFALLEKLPAHGLLFPSLAQQPASVRASRFRKCCNRLGFHHITLHSYRYAWARRAKAAGMPVRESMDHLGHGSKAVHLAYGSKEEAVTFPLEYYEELKASKLVQLNEGRKAA